MVIVFLLLFTVLTNTGVVQATDSFHFVNVGWAYEVRGYKDYDLNTDGTFPRGSRAYAYLEVEGFSSTEHDDGYLSDLAVDVSLRTRQGILLFRQTDLVDYHAIDRHPPSTLWFYIWVDIPRWAPRATYIAEVTVRDRVGDSAITKAQEIQVE